MKDYYRSWDTINVDKMLEEVRQFITFLLFSHANILTYFDNAFLYFLNFSIILIGKN